MTSALLKCRPKPIGFPLASGGSSVTSKDLEALVKTVCTAGDWVKASQLIIGAHNLSMVPTWRTYKELLQCLAVKTNWEMSLPVLNSLAEGQMGTHALFRSFLSLCADAGDGESLRHILEEASRKGVSMSHDHYLRVALCYLKCDMINQLMELPAQMGKDRVPVTSDLLSVLLAGCARCGGYMAEHAKMIIEHTKGVTEVTSSVARNYLLSLGGSDWELGTRQYLAMPYDVRQDSGVMGALACLMGRGGRWEAAFELVTNQLWSVKGYTDDAVNTFVDDYTRARSVQAPDWQSAATEAQTIFFNRKGYTTHSGDVVLECIFENKPGGADPLTEKHVAAAAAFVFEAITKVPQTVFSPSSLLPLLKQSQWEISLELLANASKIETRHTTFSSKDNDALIAFMQRVDVPTKVVLDLLKFVPSAASDTIVIGRLMRETVLDCSTSDEQPLEDAIVDLSKQIGPHQCALVLYENGFWRKALTVLRLFVKGPNELSEKILFEKKMWKEAIEYAERCDDEDRDAALRGLAVPICTVCNRWGEVERILDLIGAKNDLETHLLGEARRRNRQTEIEMLMNAGKIYKAYSVFEAFNKAEPALKFDSSVEDRLCLALLDSEGSNSVSHAVTVGKRGSAASSQNTKRPSVALIVASQMSLSDLSKESEPAIITAFFILKPDVSLLPLVLDIASDSSNVTRLASTAAFVDTLTSVMKNSVAISNCCVPLPLLKSLGNVSPAVDAALQRMAVGFVKHVVNQTVTSSEIPTFQWENVLYVFNCCSSVSVAVLSELVTLAISMKTDLLVLKGMLWPLVSKTLREGTNSEDSKKAAVRLPLAVSALELAQQIGDYEGALQLYSSYPELLSSNMGSTEQFLNVCARASGQSESSLRQVTGQGNLLKSIQSLLNSGQWKLAARLYITQRNSPLFLRISARKELLQELVKVLLDKDPISVCKLVLQENLEDVGIEVIDPLLVSLTHLKNSQQGERLLLGAQLLEWVSNHDPRLVTDKRISVLLNACVPYSTCSNTKNLLKRTLHVLKRISKCTNNAKIVNSVAAWVAMDGVELFDELVEPTAATPDELQHTLAPVPSVERATQWTEERKQRVAKYYQYLKENAPPLTEAGVGDAEMAPFAYVSVKEFSGEVSAKDVRSLWYRNSGGSQRHLGRLYESLRLGSPSPHSPLESPKPSFSKTKISSKDKNEKTRMDNLAANMAVIRFASEEALANMCSEFFPNETPTSLRTIVYKSGAALRSHIRDNPSLIRDAHTRLPSAVPQQLLARLSDYARSELLSPSIWRAIAHSVFHGGVTAEGVGVYIRRHLATIRSAISERWTREAERELADCVSLSGAPPKFLETDPSRTRHEISSYYKKYHWVLRQRGSFSPLEIETISGVYYPFHNKPTENSLGEAALDACLTTHTIGEVEAVAARDDAARHRMADAWHSSLNVGAAEGNVALTSDGVGFLPMVSETPLVPRICGHRYGKLSFDGESKAEEEEESPTAFSLAKRLAVHQWRELGYIRYQTARKVINAVGDEELNKACEWLTQRGFSLTEKAARKMKGTESNLSTKPSEATWLKEIQHLPLLHGSCKVLLSLDTLNEATSTKLENEGASRARDTIVSELVRLSKGRTSKEDAREAWSLMLRHGYGEKLSNTNVLDIAVALAEA